MFSNLAVDKSVLLAVDYQLPMKNGIKSHDASKLEDAAWRVVRGAVICGVPPVFTTIHSKSPQKDFSMALQEASEIPDEHMDIFDRSIPNLSGFDALADPALRKELLVHLVEGRTQLVLMGWWTSMCCAFTAKTAIELGFQVFVVVDAIGDATLEAHNMGVSRMVQFGAQPMTWMPVVSAWMVNWPTVQGRRMKKEVFGRVYKEERERNEAMKP